MQGELLEDHPDSLQLVGYGPYLRWIVRECKSEGMTFGPQYSPSWPLEKVVHWTTEDFGHADWEWLLRHRDYKSFGTLRDDALRSCEWLIT